jgi:predicted transglutaminase-like protease
MENLFEPPSKQTWEQRSLWIENELEKAEVGMSYLASDHSTALFYDMQRAYCAGAWISVVVLAVSSIDSHLRETESGDNTIRTDRLLREFYEGEPQEIEWLRKLRNRYVHLDMDKPFLEIDTWFTKQSQLEEDATKAIKIAIKAFFQSPGT